jgi:hypothetical protein
LGIQYNFQSGREHHVSYSFLGKKNQPGRSTVMADCTEYFIFNASIDFSFPDEC